MSEEIHYNLLKCLENNPNISQRELARELGISLGKVNYCVRALIDKGWIKARNFKNSHNKIAYTYALTPTGLQQKAMITVRFLKRKVQEYELLCKEIEELRREMKLIK